MIFSFNQITGQEIKMACCGHSACFGFGLFLLILTLILDVIGVGSPYWILGSVNGEKVYMGLWQMCTSGSIVGYEFSGCTDFDEVPGKNNNV